MAENETRVLYKAIADFSALSRAAMKARKDIADLKREERDLNSSSARNQKALEANQRKNVSTTRDLAKETRSLTNALKTQKTATEGANSSTVKYNRNLRTQLGLMQSLSRATRTAANEQRKLNSSRGGTKTSDASITRENTAALNSLTESLGRHASALERVNTVRERSVGSSRRYNRDLHETGTILDTLAPKVHTVNERLDSLRQWRPRLIPPFIALIPVIGALLGMINPLIAGIGALGTAAFGFASSLVSLSGAALSALPGLAALLSLIVSIKTAFSGVSDVFKQYSAMKKAAGTAAAGGGDNKAELTQEEQILRAQEKYRRSIQDVTWAQEDLTQAKEDYIQKLKELKKALDDANKAEGVAYDNARLSQEFADQVRNDPNVAQEDQVAAQDFANEKKKEAEEAAEAAAQAKKDYEKTKATGVNGDRGVIEAQRALTNAIWAQRDAQLDLINAQRGGVGSASALASATAAYKAALAALSPSARKVVLDLIDLKDRWDKAKKSVQESFFSKIAGSVKDLNKLLGPLTDLLSATAGAAGKAADNIIKTVTGPDWIRDIDSISDTNVAIVTDLGDALANVLQMVKDLTVAAGPFTEYFVDALAKGVQNLTDLVSTARDDGSLADWLGTVQTRLQQWWRIIKNIGVTLFNYGAATSEFGTFLTDGLEKLTEKWRDSSKKAREAGSPFQQYLKNIQPLLTSVAKLTGDFFRWLKREAVDPQNILAFTSLIEALREAGPKISNVLDQLAAANIGTNLIEALGRMSDLVGIFLESGGTQGLQSFFKVLGKVFVILGKLIDITPDWAIEGIAISLATIAALNFLGLNKAVSLLYKAMTSKVLISTLDKLLVAGGMKGFPTLTGRTTATTAGGTAVGSTGKSNARAVGRLALGTGSMIALSLAGSAVSDGQGGARDVGGSALTGAGYGAFLGSMIAPGVGTLAGAVIGAVVTGTATAVNQWAKSQQNKHDQRENYLNSHGKQFYYTNGTIPEEKEVTYTQARLMDQRNAIYNQSGYTQSGGLQNQAMASYEKGGANYGLITPDSVQFGNADVNQAYNGLYNSLIKAEAEQKRFNNAQFQAAKAAEKAAAEQNAYNQMLQTAISAQNEATNAYLNENEAKRQNAEASEYLRQVLANAADEKERTGKISAQTQRDIERATENAATATQNYAQAVLDAGGTQKEANAITDKGRDSMDKLAKKYSFAKDEIKGVKDQVLALPENVTVDVRIKTDDAQIKLLYALVDAMHAGPKVTAAQIANFSKAMNQVYGSVNGKNKTNKNTGGPIVHRSVGGNVPGFGWTDSVPTMLTPGEFVVRKSAVSKIGADNLQKMNMGQVPDIQFFNRGGMVQGPIGLPSGLKASGTTIVNNYTMENVVINNPRGKTSEESVIQAGRELAYTQGWQS